MAKKRKKKAAGGKSIGGKTVGGKSGSVKSAGGKSAGGGSAGGGSAGGGSAGGRSLGGTKKLVPGTPYSLDAMIVGGCIFLLGVGYFYWSMPWRGLVLMVVSVLCALAGFRGRNSSRKDRGGSRGRGGSGRRDGNGGRDDRSGRAGGGGRRGSGYSGDVENKRGSGSRNDGCVGAGSVTVAE